MTSAIDARVSRPTKSASVNGPIGWLAPAFIPVSMSSIEPDALLVGADRVEHVGDQQPVDDEAPVVPRGDRGLAELLAELEAELHGVVAGRRPRAPPRAAASPGRG